MSQQFATDEEKIKEMCRSENVSEISVLVHLGRKNILPRGLDDSISCYCATVQGTNEKMPRLKQCFEHAQDFESALRIYQATQYSEPDSSERTLALTHVLTHVLQKKEASELTKVTPLHSEERKRAVLKLCEFYDLSNTL